MDILKWHQTEKIYKRKGVLLKVVCFAGEPQPPAREIDDEIPWIEENNPAVECNRIRYTIGNPYITCDYYLELKDEYKRIEKELDELNKRRAEVMRLMATIEITIADKIRIPGTYLVSKTCVIVEDDHTNATIHEHKTID